MVLEAAGKTDGDMLVKNAKDFAATIRQLKKWLDETQDHALQAEDRLEELECNKENEPPVCSHPNHCQRSNSTSTYDLPEYAGVCPTGLKTTMARRRDSTFPTTMGTNWSPSSYGSSRELTHMQKGPKDRGSHFSSIISTPLLTMKDTDLPLAQMPIWFTAALSRHNNMYNVVL
jgi:hypothetical protein